jgi:hypothetical protein
VKIRSILKTDTAFHSNDLIPNEEEKVWFTAKCNKATRTDIWKTRSVVITNKRFMYLRTEDHVNVPLNRISGVTISTKPNVGTLVVHVDNGRDFRLYTTVGGTQGMRDVFVYQLEVSYSELMHKNLPIYGVD